MQCAPSWDCTIGSFDVSKRQRALRKRERSRARKEMKRRAAGQKSRVEFLAAAKSQRQPWKAEGISRRTWYRQRGVAQVRPHPPYPHVAQVRPHPTLSKAEPHLLMDRKEMAEGAMAPKCECNNPAPRGCKGEMAVSGPVLRRNRMDMNVIELDGRWHVIEGGAVLHVRRVRL